MCSYYNLIHLLKICFSSTYVPLYVPVNLNNPGNQRDSQIREGEIKNLKNKIKQLEIQLCNTKQEQDDKFKTLKNIIDCKDTELKFQVSYL